MSYVLHIWESPTPTSLAEAAQTQMHLVGQSGTQNAKFVALAEHLTERFPCPMAAQEDDDDANAVWSDGPIDGRTTRGFAAITGAAGL